MTTNPLQLAIVIPCLNEATGLEATCASLGFSHGGPERENLELYVVDNGSEDGTLEVAKRIAAGCRAGAVHVGREPRRGYVPPRRHGIAMVENRAKTEGWNLNDVVVLQADGDTGYAPGYVDAMADIFQSTSGPVLAEGHIEYSPRFRLEHPTFLSLVEQFDADVLRTIDVSSSAPDALVTDAVSAYRLCDYCAWGEHRDAQGPNNEPVHAETTRLFLSALSTGARKQRVDGAVAYPSPRKTVIAPAIDFASAGFPRAESWFKSQPDDWRQTVPLEDFAREHLAASWNPLKETRRRHIVGLFGLLPVHVGRILDLPVTLSGAFSHLVTRLPRRSRADLRAAPGDVIHDVLKLVDDDSAWTTEPPHVPRN